MDKARRRSGAWRLELPMDINSPLVIKRTPAPKRRVTFQDIWLNSSGSYTDDPVLQSKDDAYSMAPLTGTRSTNRLLRSPSVGESGVYVYENCNYRTDDVEKDVDQFVLAFGRKGKDVGDFEDAKDVIYLDGDLVITDMILGRVQKFSNKASTVSVLATADVTCPWSVTATENGQIALTLCKERVVKLLTTSGEVIQTFGEDYLRCPTGITCDQNGRFIVCDADANKVLVFSAKGEFIQNLGEPVDKKQCFSKPRYACVSPNGNVIISDSGNHKVKIFNSDGIFMTSFGSFGKGDGQFKYPYGVCTNSLGEILVADHYNSRVSLFSPNGVFIRHLLTREHGLVHPQGIAMDPSMHLYVTHGQLKATEILIFRLSNATPVTNRNASLELISYV